MQRIVFVVFTIVILAQPLAAQQIPPQISLEQVLQYGTAAAHFGATRKNAPQGIWHDAAVSFGVAAGVDVVAHFMERGPRWLHKPAKVLRYLDITFHTGASVNRFATKRPWPQPVRLPGPNLVGPPLNLPGVQP